MILFEDCDWLLLYFGQADRRKYVFYYRVQETCSVKVPIKIYYNSYF
jgi:hypothetical protein